MHLNLQETFDGELALAKNLLCFQYNEKLFASKVEEFDKNALKAYIVLCIHFNEHKPEALEKLRIITPAQFLDRLNRSRRLIETEKQLGKYLVYMFEVIVTLYDCIENDEFRESCGFYLSNALRNESIPVISTYLQMFHRLDRISSKGTPVELIQKIAEAVHGPIADQQIFIEALLLIESSIQKQHSLSNPNSKAAEILKYLWNDLCPSNIMKHQCDKCYTITSQLIDVYLKGCKLNSIFRSQFLAGDFWNFIRAAIESKAVVRRKQAIYMLQQVLEMDQMDEITIATTVGKELNDVKTIWKNFFTVLESLLEIQCQLILSCLEQYLEGIVKTLPLYWYTTVLTLILQHHNNVIVHYGIEFILKHQINVQYENNLMTAFLMALNNTYMFTEVKFSEKKFAEFLATLNVNHVLMAMNQITWRPVPLWTIVKTFDIFVENSRGTGMQIPLFLNFLKRSVREIKNIPLADQFLISILKNIGYKHISLEQLLSFHQILPNDELFADFEEPLVLQNFEEKLINLEQISPTTKIAYFRHALPAIRDRIRLLDSFYERNLNRIVYYPHYEYLLFDTMCLHRPLIELGSSALLTLKPRLYNIIKLKNGLSVETVLLGSIMLRFIVEKHLDVEQAELMIFESIKKVLMNTYEFYSRIIDSTADKTKLNMIRDNLTVVSGKLIRCIELYPNCMEVLGILNDVAVIDGQIPDLSRFRAEQEDDVRLVQSLYDCFIEECEDLKPAHKANVVTRMISSFPNLQVDICNVYGMLLNAQADIRCLFALTHPDCISQMNSILANAIIYGNEMKGEEKQEYDFIASKRKSTTYIQKVRLTAMRIIAKRNQLDQIRTIKNLLFAKNTEICRLRYYTHSYHHTLKLRLAQAFAFLFRLDRQWDDRIFKIIMEEANQVNVTHINELIIAETIDAYHMIDLIEKVEGNKGLQSMFITLYYICCKKSDPEYIRQSIELLTKYIFAKQIMVRTAAQIVLIKLYERFDTNNEYKTIYDCMKRSHSLTTSRALKYAYAYEYRFTQIDLNNPLHSMYIQREIPRITMMSSDEYYKDEIFDPFNEQMVIHISVADAIEVPVDSVEIDICFMENADESMIHSVNGNVQRKIVTYRETFIDRKILNSLPKEFAPKHAKSELIVLSSYISKTANLGGISRSAEVFGVKALAIDNLKFLKQSEFTATSMAAEKWIKYLEVKRLNIVSYLMAMKASGYAIVGAEQTAFGQKLHQSRFPKKMVLVLGHEKDGIPANVLNILDMAIEVPQFGVVRSLNVHVTASLFMWEYCKQHLIPALESIDEVAF